MPGVAEGLRSIRNPINAPEIRVGFFFGHLQYSADAPDRQRWCEMLAAMRHRAALEQERSTVDGEPSGDAGDLNRWFYRLDRLLNRDGTGDAEEDEGSGSPPS